ncbi:hypothetical protein L207DRAFT_587421 [Hyaloscypha variabilis F]|uniref:Uncharacterized protein n=1 Tax=Hyaloscypha variabilis (strain UAMH 11265 / GT02V1 / F) TaxID=1149755 RepID=A0A2J6RD30_HYAVF|nr:hypothetical protein L207DRAFT_587421 [Hyaloscypha variabilis F]
MLTPNSDLLTLARVVAVVAPSAQIYNNAINESNVTGNSDPTSLVAMPNRYLAKFVPRNEAALRKLIEKFVAVK